MDSSAENPLLQTIHLIKSLKMINISIVKIIDNTSFSEELEKTIILYKMQLQYQQFQQPVAKMKKDDMVVLLLPIIISNSKITEKKQQLRSLLMEKMGYRDSKDLENLIQCLLAIVKQSRHPHELVAQETFRDISKFLGIQDATNYLSTLSMGKLLTSKERMDQLKQRWKQHWRQKKREYQALLQKKKFKSWGQLIRAEYDKGTPFRKLVPFITPQNFPSDRSRAGMMLDIIDWEYNKKGTPFLELVRYITPQNIPDGKDRSDLWNELITKEYERGTPFHELVGYITPQNIPDRGYPDLLGWLIQEEYYTKDTPFSEIVPFITPPDYYLLYGIIQNEHSQSKESFEKFIPYILPHSSPERSNYRFDRSMVWYHLILEEYKRGTPINQLIPFMTEENIPILTLLSTLFSKLNIPM
jgi:hypothetical protein